MEVIYSRAPVHESDLQTRLQAGDIAAAAFVGITPQVFAALPPRPLDAAAQGLLAPLLEKASLTAAINDAWQLITVLTGVALLCVPFAHSGVPDPGKDL